jgi:hypothetical protein
MTTSLYGRGQACVLRTGGAPNPTSHRIPATGMERLWSLAGATGDNRWQIGRPRNGGIKPKPLPPVATSCRGTLMVRRGSTVRVRQRALQKRRKSRFLFGENLHDLQRAVGMEPFMEPSGSERTLQSIGNGRIRPDCLTTSHGRVKGRRRNTSKDGRTQPVVLTGSARHRWIFQARRASQFVSAGGNTPQPPERAFRGRAMVDRL